MSENIEINKDEIIEYESLRQDIGVGASAHAIERLVLENRSSVVTAWELVTLEGLVIFRSGNYLKRQDCVLKLSELGIPIGLRFRLRAAAIGRDRTSEEIMYYEPTSTTTYFYRLTGTALTTVLTYLGDIVGGSGADEDKVSDIVKETRCNKAFISNIAWVIIKICLMNLDYQTIYISGRYTRNETWEFDLATLNVPAGTKLIVKVRVIGGKDCASDVIINYQPTINETALYQVEGGVATSKINFLGNV